MTKIIKYLVTIVFIWNAVLILHSCANMASPTGGPYDETPPRLVRSNPANNALNVNKRVIEIEFDENIKIEKPSEKVIITPPQIDLPVIKSIGKKAIVELNDELIENTTYTIDFTDAIVDNNESNPLENFSLSFSTGEVLDTLAVSGTVLSADNLEPQQGIYVGMHTNLSDTAFTHLPFERISRTDSRGKFTVRGLAPGEYRIFALKDNNRDYKYDNPQEAIAFLDSIVIPSSMPAVRQDTIFKDSVTVDSIRKVDYTRFLPDDLILRSFESGFKRKYLQKHERPKREKIQVFFAAPTQEAKFELITPIRPDSSWYVKESNLDNDSLQLWITDSLVFKQDTLFLKLDYLRTDSLNLDQLQTDTLRFIFKEPRQSRREKSQAKDEQEEIKFLNIKTNIQSAHEVYAPIRIEFEEPVIDFDSTKVKLVHQVDSLFEDVAFTFTPDTVNPRKFTIRHKWKPDENYKLKIDSASIHNIYGLTNNKLDQAFKIKSLDQYGNLLFQIQGLPENKTAYVELLDTSDKPFRKVKVKNNEALIFDIDPGKIFARLFIDENDDGEWTTGNYEKGRQPEMVYYYPREFEVRAYTDHEESWNLQALPLDKQKPAEITKNKPEEKKRKNLNQERERQQRGQQGSRSSTPAMGGPTRMTGMQR